MGRNSSRNSGTDSSTTAHCASLPTLFHISETAGITCFEPRPDTRGEPRGWAIGEARLHNYLLPRDCPGVTYYATSATRRSDQRRFFSGEATVSVDDVPARPVELRVLANLWPLRDAAVASSLAFSIIRMRNALPPPAAPEAALAPSREPR